jgi:Alpha-L-arabinofuranosidase B (ABFB) domain
MSQRWRSLSVAMMLLVAPLAGAGPAGGQSEEGNSVRSWKLPGPLHPSSGRPRPHRQDRPADKLGRKDGTFRIAPGLAGQCRSFESVNYPGHVLRHQDSA